MTDKKINALLIKQYALTDVMQENMRLFLKRSPTPSDGYVKAKLEGLVGAWQEFKSNHEQLLSLHTAETLKEEEYFKKNVYAHTEDVFCEFSARYEELLPPASPKESTPNSTETPLKSKIKLPTVNVPVFNGNVQDWCSFKSLFRTLIHDRQDLSDVERLQYLKGTVQGEASQIIKHFSISGPNYKAAWQLLTDRYENTRLIVDVLLSNLTSLPTLKNDSIAGYKNMVDTVNECVHSLTNLKISVSSWDPLLIHLLVPKLPPATVRDWEKDLGSVKTLPTLAQFLEFLTKTFQMMETSRRISTGTNAPTTTTKVRSLTANVNETRACPMCNADHSLRGCTAFRQMTVQGRLEFLRNKSICRNCLSLHHQTARCQSTTNCRYCQRRHHSYLHIPNSSSSPNGVSQAPVQPINHQNHLSDPAHSLHERSADSTSYTIQGSTPGDVNVRSSRASNVSAHAGTMETTVTLPTTNLLATALLDVSFQGFKVPVRALVDPGSQATFITSRIIQMLRATTHSVSLHISGIGGVPIGAPISRATVNMGSRTESEFNLPTEVLILPKITQLLPPHLIDMPELHLHRQFILADPQFQTPGPIDMLLGVDVFAQILLPGLHTLSERLKMQNTKLGWIIFGSTAGLNVHHAQPRMSIVGLHTHVDDDAVLKRFWELESIPTESVEVVEHDPCEQHYKLHTTRSPDGRYEVKLPFRDKTPSLGRSSHIAKAAFLHMEKKLLQSPALYQHYQECFNEYLALGHMKPASVSDNHCMLSDERCRNYRCYYMPHHGVVKESSTTKLRVVFNASQKTDNGNSLNDLLYTGPRLQNDIAMILAQWRLFPIALTADIAKMYLQIKVHPSDHPYQRVMWRANPTMSIVEYELNTVTFGVTTAPYLALRTLHRLAEDDGDQFPLAAQHLRKNFYVDDYLGGTFDNNAALELINQLSSLLRGGGFHLRKWVSNHNQALIHVPIEDRESLEHDKNVVPIIKTLGVKWNPSSDLLQFGVPAFPPLETVTKRSMLSWIASIFDPLGLLAPLVIVCKVFMQRLWLEGLQWDDVVGDEIEKDWKAISLKCQTIQPITIPRWYRYAPGRHMELHGFCDASKRAYAAVFYLRSIDSDEVITSRLIISKTRVAPIKTVSIPRLELCGAALLIKLLLHIRRHLSALDVPFFLWTDSQVVLAWLRREPNNWTTFVANRVSFIQTHSTPNDWSYIRSSDNPADAATRGLSATELTSNVLWWSGPHWLTNHTYERHPGGNIAIDTPEESKPHLVVAHTASITMPWLTNFSSLTRLIRVTAYITRFLRLCKINTAPKQGKSLSVGEIQEATKLCVRAVQLICFNSEIHALKQGHSLPSKSTILSFNPMLDQDGILRVGGRLANSDLAYAGKHPILLPSHHPYTVLVIRHAHAQTLHGGVEMTAAYIRATYWIIRSRSTIRKVLHMCISCFRHARHSSTQLMADLPRERVIAARPFTYTGVDYAGPITLKHVGIRSTKTFHGYISVFVCFTVKAYHLELVSELTAEAFLAAFRRFIARRGLPHTIFSDCGTNFVGASNLLTRYREAAVDYCSTRGVEWKFIPPAAPHFGGLWEAGVKLVKTHLKKILGTVTLNFEEYATILAQIEACLNSRPLCPVTDDVHDYSVLTPGHFLTGSNLIFPPQPDHSESAPNYLRRWQRVQQLYQNFWRRWSAEYLSRQQPRVKWKKTTPNLQENDLVLIRDERLSPLQWKRGRIISTSKGTDNLVRVANVRTADGILKRPITKLFKLPATEFDNRLVPN